MRQTTLDEFQAELKAQGVTAESIADAMETLDKLPPSRARFMTQTKLDEAMMWLNSARPVKNETQS